MNYLSTHLGEIGTLTLQHVALVFSALAIALAVALPLGIAAARSRRFSIGLLALLGILYAIPSLALLAVLVRYIGLGAAPVVIVLAIYAQFILVRNIGAALTGVPAAQVDAAIGMGMSSRQRLWRVELPLGFPVILGGIRVATVAMIAIATLGGYVGAGGLGADIFFGLQRRYIEQTLAGSIPAALLAILADAAFRGVERLAARRTSG